MTERTVPPVRSAPATVARLVVITVVVAIVLASSSVTALLLQHHLLGSLTTSVAPALSANRQVFAAMADAETGIDGFAHTRQPLFLRAYERSRQPLTDGLAELAAVATEAHVDPLAARQGAAAQTWLRDYAGPVARGAAPTSTELQRAAATLREFRTTNSAIAEQLSARSTRLAAQSNSITVAAIVLLGLIGVAGVLAAVRRGVGAARAVGPPLENLDATLVARLAGDRSARADSVDGVTEVRAVATSLNQLIEVSERQRDRLADDLGLADVVRRIGLEVGDSLHIGDVVDHSTGPLTDGFRARAVWVRAFDGEGELPGRGRGARHPQQQTTIAPTAVMAAARRWAEAAWSRGTAVVLDDAHTGVDVLLDDADREAIRDFPARLGLDALLMAPIGTGTECLGYLILARGPEQPRWTASETEAAVRVGRDLGRAVVHARLYERERLVVEQVRALDARKSEFVSTVSHELRTPLAAIVGHLELIRSGDLGEVSDDAHDSLDALDRNSRRLTVLIENLLMLSRVEEGVQPTKLRPVDLHEITDDVVSSHRPGAAKHGVDLHYLSAGPVPVLGDQGELERVVANLVSNAVKFSPTGSPVEVRIDQTDDSAVLQVIDQGPGISAADQQQLFTRFFRSTNPAAQAVPGTGLGLAITKLIVEKHRGTIELTSALGAGSTFSVTLATPPSASTPPGVEACDRLRTRDLKGALT